MRAVKVELVVRVPPSIRERVELRAIRILEVGRVPMEERLRGGEGCFVVLAILLHEGRRARLLRRRRHLGRDRHWGRLCSRHGRRRCCCRRSSSSRAGGTIRTRSRCLRLAIRRRQWPDRLHGLVGARCGNDGGKGRDVDAELGRAVCTLRLDGLCGRAHRHLEAQLGMAVRARALKVLLIGLHWWWSGGRRLWGRRRKRRRRKRWWWRRRLRCWRRLGLRLLRVEPRTFGLRLHLLGSRLRRLCRGRGLWRWRLRSGRWRRLGRLRRRCRWVLLDHLVRWRRWRRRGRRRDRGWRSGKRRRRFGDR